MNLSKHDLISNIAIIQTLTQLETLCVLQTILRHRVTSKLNLCEMREEGQIAHFIAALIELLHSWQVLNSAMICFKRRVFAPSLPAIDLLKVIDILEEHKIGHTNIFSVQKLLTCKLCNKWVHLFVENVCHFFFVFAFQNGLKGIHKALI